MDYFAIQVSAGAAAQFEATLNGMPVVRKKGNDTLGGEYAVQADVVPGANTVAVALGRSPRPTTVDATPKLFVEVRVQADHVTELPTAAQAVREKVAELVWRPATAGKTQEQRPPQLTMTFQATVARGPMWLDAAPLSPAVSGEAQGRVLALAALLAAGDIDGYVAAGAMKHQDMARAFPMVGDAARMAEMSRVSLRTLFARPGARLIDVATLEPAFPVHAGRVVEALGTDGEPLLRVAVADQPRPVPIKLMLARLGGELAPIR